MLSRMQTLTAKFDLRRCASISLGGGILILACMATLRLLMPIQDAVLSPNSPANIVTADNPPEVAEMSDDETKDIARVFRAGLFRPATPARDKPLADQTIQRIRSQLQLQCFMELNGEPVAYVYVKGEGLKQCKVGDVVEDLFRVLDISEKCVVIEIVGHREVLSF